MNTLGLDLATRSIGWAVYDGKQFKSGTFRTNKPEVTRRIYEIQTFIESLLDKYEIDEICIEQPITVSRQKYATYVAYAGGVVYALAGKYVLPLTEIPISVAKKHITGNGRADKPVVRDALIEKYDFKGFSSFDASDAVAVLITHLRL